MVSILFVSKHFYLPDRTGGLEVSTHELCSALLSQNIKVAVLCVGPRRGSIICETSSPFGLSVDCELGYPAYRSDDPARVLGTVVSLQNADVAVLHVDRNLMLVDAVALANVRTLFYFRDVQFSSEAWRLKRSRRAAFAANSIFCAERAQLELGIECRVLPPLIQRERYLVETTRQQVVFVNPVPKKGVEIALEVASLRPNIPFMFVEAWPISDMQRNLYRSRAVQLPNVRWHEATSDMREIYATARILLVPSVCEESWGRVVTEAQISGIPAIASNRGGLPESVGEGGIIVDDIGNVAQWLSAIDSLWSNDRLYSSYSDAARQQAQRPEMAADEILNNFLNLVDHLVLGE